MSKPALSKGAPGSRICGCTSSEAIWAYYMRDFDTLMTAAASFDCKSALQEGMMERCEVLFFPIESPPTPRPLWGLWWGVQDMLTWWNCAWMLGQSLSTVHVVPQESVHTWALMKKARIQGQILILSIPIPCMHDYYFWCVPRSFRLRCIWKHQQACGRWTWRSWPKWPSKFLFFFFFQTAGIDTWNPARLSGKFMHAAILFLGTGQLQSTFVLARALRD